MKERGDRRWLEIRIKNSEMTFVPLPCRKGDRIYHQLKKLGSSLDWDRACFTMDPVSFLKSLK